MYVASSAASSYLLHPDAYLPRAASDSEAAAPSVREPDASSFITLLEERHSLLGGARSGSELSAHLCEIEDSDDDAGPRQTDV